MSSKYEYKVITFRPVDPNMDDELEEEKVLNEYGKQGYKLINVLQWDEYVYFYFMKEK
jgi:hypothetical protein